MEDNGTAPIFQHCKCYVLLFKLIPHKDAEESASRDRRYCPLFAASQTQSYTFLLYPVGL